MKVRLPSVKRAMSSDLTRSIMRGDRSLARSTGDRSLTRGTEKLKTPEEEAKTVRARARWHKIRGATKATSAFSQQGQRRKSLRQKEWVKVQVRHRTTFALYASRPRSITPRNRFARRLSHHAHTFAWGSLSTWALRFRSAQFGSLCGPTASVQSGSPSRRRAGSHSLSTTRGAFVSGTDSSLSVSY